MVKNNLNIIPKSFEAIHINFPQIYIAFIHKMDSHWMDHFFVLYSKAITEKIENTVFGHKNGSKFKKYIIFENFGG